jgi:hypothetical protein
MVKDPPNTGVKKRGRGRPRGSGKSRGRGRGSSTPSVVSSSLPKDATPPLVRFPSPDLPSSPSMGSSPSSPSTPSSSYLLTYDSPSLQPDEGEINVSDIPEISSPDSPPSPLMSTKFKNVYGMPPSDTEIDESDPANLQVPEEPPKKLKKTSQGRGRGGGRGRGRGKGRTPFLGTRLDSGSLGEQMTYGGMKTLVVGALPEGMLQEWNLYLELPLNTRSIERMWGGEQPPGFLSHMVTMWAYKDLTGWGYKKILERVDVGFKITHKSFGHNAQIIRRLLFAWSKGWIVLQSSVEWDMVAINFPSRKGLKKVNLCLDSSDFRRAGKSSMSKKDAGYSFKLDAPGQRYQLLVNAHGLAVGLWGGYSPKVYDGDWIKVMREFIGQNFKGAHIIADTHYETANRTMKEDGIDGLVKFYTPFSKPRGPKKTKKRKKADQGSFLDDPSEGMKVLTAEQEQWNRNVAHVRSRVESPFGLIKQKWKGLDLFYGDEAQQNYLLFIAVASRNFELVPDEEDEEEE